LKKIKLPRTIGVRLTLWFACIFISFQIVFFTATYYFLHSILKNRDFNDILTETGEISAELKSEGIEGFHRFVNNHLSSRLKEILFIRLASENNRTLFKFSPESADWFDFSLTHTDIPDSGKWLEFRNEKKKEEVNIYSKHIEPDLILQVGMSSIRRDSILNQFKKMFLLVISPLIFISLASAAFFSVKFLKPVRDIITTVKSIELGKMDSRVPRTWNNDELDELAGLFNQMLEKIENLINAMKESLDNTAHDLRTPLTRLRNIAEAALNEFPDEQLSKEAHESAIEESERILKILETIMDIAEAENGIMTLNYQLTDLHDVVYPVYDLYSYVAETKGISIQMDVEKEIMLYADSGKISQAVANIIDNAVKFTPDRGHIYINAFKEKNSIVISVEDTGPGIDEKDAEKIFERLYRAKSSSKQKGLGLGLSLVKAIVKAHKGIVALEKSSSHGAVFKIILPA
jgi:signal transduction histidine kinase